MDRNLISVSNRGQNLAFVAQWKFLKKCSDYYILLSTIILISHLTCTVVTVLTPNELGKMNKLVYTEPFNTNNRVRCNVDLCIYYKFQLSCSAFALWSIDWQRLHFGLKCFLCHALLTVVRAIERWLKKYNQRLNHCILLKHFGERDAPLFVTHSIYQEFPLIW